jgi:SAM-dependent methyltransferase
MPATYHPFLYDLTFPGGVRGDIDGYRRLARESGGPVLELGAGTGRITIPIAEDGLDIHAVDRDSGMLDALRRKAAALPADVAERITITQADMRSVRLDQRFALVIIPFRAFLHNLTPDDQLACLRSVHGQLRSGGRLAFNVFHPSLEFMSRHVGPFENTWRLMATFPTPDGGLVVRSETSKFDTPRQRLRALIRYDQFDASGALTATYLEQLELAYLYPRDIRHLLERAGFDDIRISADFEGRPFEHDTDELIVEAVRP